MSDFANARIPGRVSARRYRKCFLSVKGERKYSLRRFRYSLSLFSFVIRHSLALACQPVLLVGTIDVACPRD